MKKNAGADVAALGVAGCLAMAVCIAGTARAAWYDGTPSVRATVDVGGGTDPHYINLSEDGAYLMVNLHARSTEQPVQLYAVADLLAARGTVGGLAMASAKAPDFFGAGTGDGGWKGGALSAKLGVLIPGSGKESGALYTAFAVPSLGWKAGETAFALSGMGDAGVDGLDFNAAGTRLYANQYASGSRNRILSYDTAALASGRSLTLLSTKTVEGVTRIRNLSCYTVRGRDLVYFGEGAVSGGNNSVYVYDPAEDAVTTLVTDAALFDGDIMNVKLSDVASGCPTMYVQTDNGRLHVFLLAPDGKRVTRATPVKSFTPAQCAAFCGLSSVPAKFRNFEVTDDGAAAFFIATGGAPLCVVASGYAGDAYIASPNRNNVLFTDYFFTANSRIEVDFEFTDASNGFVFSPWEGSNFFCGLWRDGGTYKYFAGNQWNRVGPTKKSSDANVRHQTVLDAKNKVAYLVTDGVREDFDLSACSFGAVGWPIMFLGAATTYDGVRSVNTTHYARARIYSAKIYENDVLVRDYVPAIVNGVPCLYDAVNGSVAADTRDGFAHPGFGGDVRRVVGDAFVELSRSAGQAKTLGIDTGYHLGAFSRVECDFQLSNPSGDARPFGAWNVGGNIRPLAWINNGVIFFSLNKNGGTETTGTPFTEERQTLAIDATDMTFSIVKNGIVQRTVTSTGSAIAEGTMSGGPLAVFADANSGASTPFQSPAIGMKCYSFKIMESGATVTNFLPFLAIEGACLKDALTDELAKPGAPQYFSYRVVPAAEIEAYIAKISDTKATGFMTDWQLDARSRVECDFTFGRTGTGQRPFGAWNNSGSKLRTLIYTDGTTKFFINSADANFTTTQDAKRHLYAIDFTTPDTPTGYCYTDGILTTSGSGTALANTTDRSNLVSIFADNNGSAFSQSPLAGARFWGMKAYEAGQLVHDWVPSSLNGVPGIADKLTGLFMAAPSADFDAAGDLWEATSDAYIETSGGTVLDSGYKPNKTTRVEVDLTPIGIATTCLFGNYGDGNGNAWTFWIQNSHTEAMMQNGNDNSPVFFYPKSIRFVAVMDFVSQTSYAKIGGVKVDDYTADHSDRTFAADWQSRNNMGICGSLLTDTAICTSPAPASMRCYAVRIYENDVLVRLFLPYSGDDGIGLKCALTGAKALKHAASTGADPVYVAGPLAVTTDEVAQLATTGPADLRLSRDRVETVSAVAPGAAAYRWTRNGVALGETDGTLGIGWRKADSVDTFTVTPVYRTSQGEVAGASATFNVEYLLQGMTLILR